MGGKDGCHGVLIIEDGAEGGGAPSVDASLGGGCSWVGEAGCWVTDPATVMLIRPPSAFVSPIYGCFYGNKHSFEALHGNRGINLATDLLGEEEEEIKYIDKLFFHWEMSAR